MQIIFQAGICGSSVLAANARVADGRMARMCAVCRMEALIPRIVEKIRATKLLRACWPAMFGGFEYDGEVALEITMTTSTGSA